MWPYRPHISGKTVAMSIVIGEDPKQYKEPKAGSFGVFSVVFYGLVCVIAVFVAAYFWLDGDGQLAAALGIGSLAIPVTAGFFVSELRNQRAGALAFVVTAAVVAGAAAASAYYERDDYLERRDFIDPDRSGLPFLDE